MKTIRILLFFIMILCIIPIQSISGAVEFPIGQIKTKKIVDLTPVEIVTYEEFRQKDFKMIKKYSGAWSTINHFSLDYLGINTSATSELSGNYRSSNLFDGKTETAWVEGVKGNGIGEWVDIDIEAIEESVTTTPFSIWQIGAIPGYAKSEKTWVENNRVKTAIIVIHSLGAQTNEWSVFRLHFEDISKLQLFDIPEDNVGFNDYPMNKEIWFKIESVYLGSKYQDTCVSELFFTGSHSS